MIPDATWLPPLVHNLPFRPPPPSLLYRDNEIADIKALSTCEEGNSWQYKFNCPIKSIQHLTCGEGRLTTFSTRANVEIVIFIISWRCDKMSHHNSTGSKNSKQCRFMVITPRYMAKNTTPCDIAYPYSGCCCYATRG